MKMSEWLKKHRYTVRAERISYPPDEILPRSERGDYDHNASHWIVTIARKRQKERVSDGPSFCFSMGSGVGRGRPSAERVMGCLLTDALLGVESFDDFCSESGYDPDSIRDKQRWERCVAARKAIADFLGPAAFAEFLGTDQE